MFHKTPPHWYDAVKDMQVGGRKRVSDSAVVTFNGEVFFYYDHREKEPEYYKVELSLAEKLELMAARNHADEGMAQSFDLPAPMVEDVQQWPMAARVWLYKANFNNHTIRSRLGAYWHEKSKRVVIPMSLLNGSSVWIGRSVEPGRPKYLTPLGMERAGGAVVTPGESDTIVLTEDYLSAVRVAYAEGCHAMAILGTTLKPIEQVVIHEQYKHVRLWLDPDKAGATGQARLWREMGRFGGDLRRITSSRDPKYLTDADIRSKMSG